jgi:cytochrome c-type biogenesis protein CcmH/NrfF
MFRRAKSWPVKYGSSPIFWARLVQMALLCVVTIVMLGAGKSRFDRLGHGLMCSCGCGQILLECNHVGCPNSAGMIDELRAQIATGNPDVQIQNWFVAKYGAIVLASPMRGGFDNAAWIVPIVVFLLATAGTFVVVWFWKRRGGGPPSDGPGGSLVGVGVVEDAALRERIRRETEY